MPDRPGTAHERDLLEAGYSCVVGLDEAGRGAWAGPVFAGAVVLPEDTKALLELAGVVRDSKQLTAPARERAFALIAQHAKYFGVGAASSEEIDSLGIAPATRLAWRRAFEPLPDPQFLLLDAFRLPESPLPQRAIVHGDAVCLSIAAASVVAKVARDRYMREVAEGVPQYGFSRNKGYGTPQHRLALLEHGPCVLHRLSFAPLRQLRLPEAGEE